MKTFEALLLIISFAVYVSANKKVFHEAEFSDERQDERIAQVDKDQGLSEGTSVANDQRNRCTFGYNRCMKVAGTSTCFKAFCKEKYRKCLFENLASPSGIQKLCNGLLHGCSFENSCTAKMECYNKHYDCYNKLKI